MKIVLVYQCGIANVFQVSIFSNESKNRNAVRLYQGSFGHCVSFARGCAAVGANVKVAACNQAGDITNSVWSSDIDAAPFSEQFTKTFKTI